MNSAETPKPAADSIKPLVLLISIVLLVLICYGIAVAFALEEWTERGQFGDMFGAANTLFSGLAFCALAYALFLQRRELSLQRIELSLTRQELAKQSLAQTKQSDTALRAAEISALGALLQSYTQLMQAGHYQLIDPTDWVQEVLRTKSRLTDLLSVESGAHDA